jgi:hypothetical protein
LFLFFVEIEGDQSKGGFTARTPASQRDSLPLRLALSRSGVVSLFMVIMMTVKGMENQNRNPNETGETRDCHLRAEKSKKDLQQGSRNTQKILGEKKCRCKNENVVCLTSVSKNNDREEQ